MNPSRLAPLAAALISLVCGGERVGQPSANPSTSPSVSPSASGEPSLGVHALKYNVQENDGITTDAVSTQASNSTIIVAVGRGGNKDQAVPTDNKGNDYRQLGTSHTYDAWPGAGTALYASEGARGGAGHRVTVGQPSPDEITLVMVEVRNGGRVQQHNWKEVLAGRPLTSDSVTTTGPAHLVAFWFGDAGITRHTAVPNNGFQVVESLLIDDAIVQVAVATRYVAGAGTYNVTWTATPPQGAQLYLVAVQ